jgi:hypothetical protein
MKFNKFLSACLFCTALMVALCSCVMTKTYTAEEKKMLLDNSSVFVEKNDGQKVTGSKISYPSSFSKSAWVSIDDQKFEPKDIKAYQSKKVYRVKFGTENNWVWATQLKRGKINLFYYETNEHKTYYDGTKYVTHNTSTQHFVFQKDNGKLLEATLETISDMLKDNKEAYGKFNNQFKPGKILFPKQLQNHPKELFDIVDIYNGSK